MISREPGNRKFQETLITLITSVGLGVYKYVAIFEKLFSDTKTVYAENLKLKMT